MRECGTMKKARRELVRSLATKHGKEQANHNQLRKKKSNQLRKKEGK